MKSFQELSGDVHTLPSPPGSPGAAAATAARLSDIVEGAEAPPVTPTTTTATAAAPPPAVAVRGIASRRSVARATPPRMRSATARSQTPPRQQRQRFGCPLTPSGSPPRGAAALSPGSPARAISPGGLAARAVMMTPTGVDSPKQRRRRQPQQQQQQQHLPSPLLMVGSDWSATSPRAAIGPLTAETSPLRSPRRRASLSPGPTGVLAGGRSPGSRSIHFPETRPNEVGGRFGRKRGVCFTAVVDVFRPSCLFDRWRFLRLWCFERGGTPCCFRRSVRGERCRKFLELHEGLARALRVMRFHHHSRARLALCSNIPFPRSSCSGA